MAEDIDTISFAYDNTQVALNLAYVS